MTTLELADLVWRMRKWQQQYFTTRDHEALLCARDLERRVDLAVTRLLIAPNAPSLFPRRRRGRGWPVTILNQLVLSERPRPNGCPVWLWESWFEDDPGVRGRGHTPQAAIGALIVLYAARQDSGIVLRVMPPET